MVLETEGWRGWDEERREGGILDGEELDEEMSRWLLVFNTCVLLSIAFSIINK